MSQSQTDAELQAAEAEAGAEVARNLRILLEIREARAALARLGETPSAAEACPFCGGEARAITGEAREDIYPLRHFHRVYCTVCQVRQLFHPTREAALAAWNRRVSEERPTTARRYPLHPHARPNNRSGAFALRSGDRFIYDIDGRHGWADEFLHDGDAFVTWDDGTYDTIKWNLMSPESH